MSESYDGPAIAYALARARHRIELDTALLRQVRDGLARATHRIERDEALLRQALEALTLMRNKYEEYACQACDGADTTIAALRERLGETK